ncbi:MAG: hypothetical protein NVS2B16_02920 [Chloroflexota bacterium]
MSVSMTRQLNLSDLAPLFPTLLVTRLRLARREWLILRLYNVARVTVEIGVPMRVYYTTRLPRHVLSSTFKRLAFLLTGTGIGVLLLVLLLRSVHLDRLGVAFSRVDPVPLALALPFLLVTFGVKVPRWALLYGRESPRWDTLFGAMNVGYAINALLPARLGEVVRAYWIRDRAGISMVRTLSTIALERVSDGLILVVFVLITAPTVAFPGRLLGSALFVGSAFVVALAGMIVLAYGSTDDDHLLSRFLSRLESGHLAFLGRILRQTVSGLQALRNWQAVALLAFYTAIIWLANSLLLWFVLRAFQIDVPVSAAILLTGVLNLGMAVPSTPGYVGVFEYLMILVLGLYSVKEAPAVAAALGFHAIAFVPVTIIGLVYIARAGYETTLEMLQASASPGTEANP